jgi:hypothetical protein
MAAKVVPISITIPRDVLRAADRRARELDRSRSWLLVEALREYLARPAEVAAPAGGVVREPAASPYAARPGLGASRQAQLEADLALTPEERVREAERTAREGALARERGGARRLLQFDRYDDYLQWKRREDLAP